MTSPESIKIKIKSESIQTKDLEEYLIGVLERVVDAAQVGPLKITGETPFISLGVDSRQAVNLKNIVQDELDTVVSTVSVFSSQNISELSNNIMPHLFPSDLLHHYVSDGAIPSRFPNGKDGSYCTKSLASVSGSSATASEGDIMHLKSSMRSASTASVHHQKMMSQSSPSRMARRSVMGNSPFPSPSTSPTCSRSIFPYPLLSPSNSFSETSVAGSSSSDSAPNQTSMSDIPPPLTSSGPVQVPSLASLSASLPPPIVLSSSLKSTKSSSPRSSKSHKTKKNIPEKTVYEKNDPELRFVWFESATAASSGSPTRESSLPIARHSISPRQNP